MPGCTVVGQAVLGSPRGAPLSVLCSSLKVKQRGEEELAVAVDGTVNRATVDSSSAWFMEHIELG